VEDAAAWVARSVLILTGACPSHLAVLYTQSLALLPFALMYHDFAALDGCWATPNPNSHTPTLGHHHQAAHRRTCTGFFLRDPGGRSHGSKGLPLVAISATPREKPQTLNLTAGRLGVSLLGPNQQIYVVCISLRRFRYQKRQNGRFSEFRGEVEEAKRHVAQQSETGSLALPRDKGMYAWIMWKLGLDKGATRTAWRVPPK
jgi:hypothetical protein